MPCTLSTQKRALLAQTSAVMPIWTSLPYDIVRSVGDCLLDGDDIDSYMAFGAVCHDWRYATKDDPKNKKADDGTERASFKPTKWKLLERCDDLVTLINIDTGRFLRKRIPLLRRFFFIGATSSGFLLLGESTEPHRVCVLNPFTGSIAHFKVRIPRVGVRAVAVTMQAPLVVFISTEIGDIRWADQNMEYFRHFWPPHPNKLTCITSIGGNLYATDSYRSVFLFSRITTVVTKEISLEYTAPSLVIAPDTSYKALIKGCKYYLVESAGDLLLVTKPSGFFLDQPIVHRVNTETKEIEPVKSIGGRALFVSHVRCLSVDANKFPGIQRGCIYFVEPIATRGCSYYEPLDMTIVDVAENIVKFDCGWGTLRGCIRPFTLTQVFADYCRSIHYF